MRFKTIGGNFEISKNQIAELKKEINELWQSIKNLRKHFRRQGSTRGRKFRKLRDSCTGNVWLSARSRFY